jgi:hypothetical protein
VSYRDQSTARRFDKGASRDARSRDAFRGRAETGRQDLARGGADTGSFGRGKAQKQRDTGGFERTGTKKRADRSAFGGYERGSRTRDYSSRGRKSMSSSRASGRSGMSRGGGGRGRR